MHRPRRNPGVNTTKGEKKTSFFSGTRNNKQIELLMRVVVVLKNKRLERNIMLAGRHLSFSSAFLPRQQTKLYCLRGKKTSLSTIATLLGGSCVVVPKCYPPQWVVIIICFCCSLCKNYLGGLPFFLFLPVLGERDLSGVMCLCLVLRRRLFSLASNSIN